MSVLNSLANAVGISSGGAGITNTVYQPGGAYTATGTGVFPQFNSHEKVNYLNGYCKGIGWSLEHHYLPEGVSSTDGKIAILKISPVGEIIKDVGFKADDWNFYVMREPK